MDGPTTQDHRHWWWPCHKACHCPTALRRHFASCVASLSQLFHTHPLAPPSCPSWTLPTGQRVSILPAYVVMVVACVHCFLRHSLSGSCARPRSWPSSSMAALSSVLTRAQQRVLPLPAETSAAATPSPNVCLDWSVNQRGAFGVRWRDTQDPTFANRTSDKLTAVHDRIYVCRSGSAADTQAISDNVRYGLDVHRYGGA